MCRDDQKSPGSKPQMENKLKEGGSDEVAMDDKLSDLYQRITSKESSAAADRVF